MSFPFIVITNLIKSLYSLKEGVKVNDVWKLFKIFVSEYLRTKAPGEYHYGHMTVQLHLVAVELQLVASRKKS
jgi:hypothetical protein